MPATATKKKVTKKRAVRAARMTIAQATKALKDAGTAQNRKIYARHGVVDPMFGVSYANQNALAKRIGTDHALALALWKTGNHDARVLACKVGDGELLKAGELDAMVRDVNDQVTASAFTGFAGRSPAALGRAKKWMAMKGEMTRRMGYGTLGTLLKDGAEIDVAFLREVIATIEAEIHTSKNRAREAMNSCLIAIGTWVPALTKEAIAAAKQIGVVEIDHGETGCKTPDAASYIAKASAHARKKASKKPGARGKTRRGG